MIQQFQSGHTSKRIESKVSKRHLYTHIHSSVIHNSQNMKVNFQSRWWRGQTWLTSLHNNKITTKIQNNHHSEPTKIKLNGSLTTTELKKPHPSRLVGGVKTWMSWSHSHWIKIWEGYLRSEESQPHTKPPNPGFQSQEDKSPQFWLQKPVRIEPGEETSGSSSSSF